MLHIAKFAVCCSLSPSVCLNPSLLSNLLQTRCLLFFIFSTMKREITVELSSEGFYRTGIRSDITQVGTTTVLNFVMNSVPGFVRYDESDIGTAMNLPCICLYTKSKVQILKQISCKYTCQINIHKYKQNCKSILGIVLQYIHTTNKRQLLNQK